jgi:ferritin-like metal-binding protein YciE
MGLFSKDIGSMEDLFHHQIRDVYYAEKQIIKALPKMIDKASNDALKSGFQQHLEETEGQVQRLDRVFSLLGIEASGVDCPAIDGIIKEAEEVSGEVDDKQVLDAALVAAAQAVEHYEIARYGTLVSWARELGRSDCADLFEETLREEKATDRKLTGIAEDGINRAA